MVLVHPQLHVLVISISPRKLQRMLDIGGHDYGLRSGTMSHVEEVYFLRLLVTPSPRTVAL